LPIGGETWPNIVGILLGTVAIVLIVYGLCVPILSVTGRYDIVTQLSLMCNGGEGSELYQLKQDTIRACQAVAVEAVVEEEAKDYKHKVLDDGEPPNDQTEKTIVGDPSARAAVDNGETSLLADDTYNDANETNIREVDEEVSSEMFDA
jgi:hypothetical protein